MSNIPKLPEGTQLTVGSHKVKVIKYLSEGGFAHIYKVQIEPKELDSDIACLKRVIVQDKAGLDQLRKEVDVMKKLRYARSIVKYYDSHAERLESGAYQVLLLMELCPNKSLLDYMNAKIKTKLSEPEILQIMFDISLGIYEMHKMKMIHRDIKIENVLLDKDFHFKLCDFGSTSTPIRPPANQQEFQALAHDITYQTTPQYRSPEMIDLYRGFPIDEKADIWALGCFLYKLCYYITPFEVNGEIAILHASYQFPPAPTYSPDLLNLIVILLQENPIFRPNIVQIIMLVSKMLKADFTTLNVSDIYNAGPYNFQALHEYQQQRQQEMLKQQQYYQHQQQQQQQKYATPQGPQAAPQALPQAPQAPQAVPTAPQAAPTAPQAAPQALQKVPQAVPQAAAHAAPHIAPPASQSGSEGIGQSTSRSSSHSGAYMNAQSTLPEDEFVDPTINSSVESSESDLDDTLGELGDIENIAERYPSLENIIIDSEPTTKSTTASVKSSGATEPTTAGTRDYLDNAHDASTGYGAQAYPIQPKVLSLTELQKLSPEQLKKYNYEHQLFHYQVNQWLASQEPQQKQQYQQHPVNIPEQKTERHNDFQRKEAWEVQESRMNENSEKLVDDIFGSKSKSRSPSDMLQSSQKTAQSVKSEPDKTSESFSFEPPDIRLSKSNNSSRDNLYDEDIRAPKIDTQKQESLSPKVEPSFKLPGKSNNPFPVQIPLAESEVDFSDHQGKANYNPWGEYRAPEMSRSVSSPTDISRHELSRGSRHELLRTSVSRNDVPRSEVPKSEAPRSEATKSEVARNETELNGDLNALNLNDPQDRSEKRVALEEQPNLIDLEVGLDSSSSSVALNDGALYDGLSDSLIDLEVKEMQPKHHFKRPTAIPNPVDFKVEEEVIDWASDDEDPNNSAMNRLSIRSSLKKQHSRKSGEHKRSESQTGEARKSESRKDSKSDTKKSDKKRLSRLISN